MLPERIAHYEIKEKAGEGGMARVYRAYDTHYRRDVAIKIMLRRHLDNPSLRVRFNREAQTIVKLTHPTIVPLYDYGEFGKEQLPFLVMGFMPRGSLKERIAGPMQVNEVLKVMQRIGRALDYAHSLDVIHRDIKPGNILYSAEDHPHLTDFGIALLSSAGVTAMSNDRLMVGTPHYMSPEQAVGEDLDARSDVYSLGVVLFEMLTGKRPYDDDTPLTPMAVIARHAQYPIPDIIDINPDLPKGYRQVIEKAIAKDKDDRYNSATEMIADLREKSRPPAAVPVNKAQATAMGSPQAPVTQPEPKKRRSPLGLLLGLFGLMALFVICGGGALLAYSQGWFGGILPEDGEAIVVVDEDSNGNQAGEPAAEASETEESSDVTIAATLPSRADGDQSETADGPEPGGTPILRPTLAVTPPPPPAGAVNGGGAQTLFLRNLTACQEGQRAEFQPGERITFEWRWEDTFEPGEYLEIRVGPAGLNSLPISGGQLPISLANGENWFQQLDAANFYQAGVIDYEWQIAHMAANETVIRLSARGCLTVLP